ncbi:hypothetical protein DNTS_032796 [Danionella cerebrum]|uniref:Bromo domain-containing protein n=1 Tax=Danionella cerebrum TaxID=2873325 RepID=A0A553R4P7_9TELE|nr:hypothetical protein DNTS_032796 [Danionella translucida]
MFLVTKLHSSLMMLDAPVQVREALRRRMKLHLDNGESGNALDGVQNPNLPLTLTACAMNPGIPQPLDHLYNGSSDQLEEDNSTSHSDLSREQNDPEDNEDLTPEVQNAFRIFQSFKAESHKSTMAPFWHPIGPGSQICLRRMDDKFTNREYESITAFVTDFRLMLENCYRFHGVDHWISKLAQKLEIILEQKLTLLSRPLRMKTRLSVTSSGSCASEEEHPAHSSTNKRRSSSRTLNALHSHTRIGESMMVQALRLEELQRHRKERRQRDLSRKEVEEASVRELEDWDTSLLSLAEPWPVSTLWELPAIGHFLCLAQEALRLPEIVFCELERCLLMPRCSSFLARVMTALLCPDNRRGSGHRRATMPYRKWEAELRLRVHSWYTSVSTAENQTARAEKLGLCPQFFWTLGDTSPLERTPFHQLPFNQRVWLLKGLCDHVYHTQRLVQEGVLQQPIHECRESILGYDTQENVYVHFPHFCGADLRIYCQSPCGAPCIPLQEVHLKREPESEVTPLQDSERNLKELEPSKVPQIPEVQKRTKIEDLTLQGTLNTFGHFRASQNPLQVDEETTRTVEFEEKEQFQMSKIRSKGPKVEIPKGIEVQHQRSEVKMERSVEDLEGSNVRSGADLQESKVKEEMDLIALDLNEDRGGNLHQKCPSESPSPRRSNSPSSRNTQERDLKGLKTEEEVYLRVGNTCYQGFSPALNSVRHPTEDRNHRNPPQKKCSGLKESFCSQCKVSRDTTQKKKERLFEVLKANTKRRRLRLKRRQCKRSLQRLAKCIKRREGRRKLGKQVDGQVKFTSRESPSAPRPEEPTFQLVCSSLDDLRVLISKTGDQFSRLNASRKRAGQRPLKRAAVKEARLKKEFDDFKKHPEYENFTRQKVESVETGEVTSKDGLRPTEAAGELEDGEDKQRGDSEGAESGPFTRSSKRRQIEAMTDDLIPFKNAKMEHNSFLVSECNGEPLSEEQASISQLAVGSIKGSCNPIQALLAKSVGNKVTLISHAKAAMMAHELASENVQPRSLEPSQTQELTATFTTEITEHVMDTTASGGPLNKGSTREKVSVQPSDLKAVEKTMKHIVILPSNLMIKGTDNKTARLSEAAPLSLVSGITFSESKIPVQQVGPLIDASAVTTTATVATPSLMSVGLPKHTTEPKVPGTDGQKRPDDKEELKTVCIRDSQSILVTTRGGNTGVVKLQNKTAALPPNTGFKISPQLQTFLLSKSSTSSTTQAVAANLAAKSLPGVTPQSVWKDRLLLNSSTFVTTSDTPLTLNKTSTASFGKALDLVTMFCSSITLYLVAQVPLGLLDCKSQVPLELLDSKSQLLLALLDYKSKVPFFLLE